MTKEVRCSGCWTACRECQESESGFMTEDQLHEALREYDESMKSEEYKYKMENPAEPMYWDDFLCNKED